MRDVLAVSGDVLALTAARGRRFAVHRDALKRAEMYKIDELTVDAVVCDLEVATAAGPLVFTATEDMLGWDQFLLWLEPLPGFRSNWRESVILPPFAEQRTVVFEREPAG